MVGTLPSRGPAERRALGRSSRRPRSRRDASDDEVMERLDALLLLLAAVTLTAIGVWTVELAAGLAAVPWPTV